MTNDDTDTDSLASVIKTLQQRIRDRATGRNETRTRNVLINPLLDGLGWSDPSVVTHEYSIEYGRGFVDYALHPKGQKGRPIAFIEAKRLRETLCDDHLNQVLKYASKRDSVRYVGLTNGDRWQFYEIFEGGWGLIFEISLRHESAFDCAAQLVRFKRRLEGLEDAEDTEGLGDLGLTQETGQTLYHQLGVDQSASREALREAYRRKIRQVHPDVSVDGLAHEKTKRINEAYSVLRDPIRRSQYDRELAATRKAPQETSPHPERPAPPPPTTVSKRQFVDSILDTSPAGSQPRRQCEYSHSLVRICLRYLCHHRLRDRLSGRTAHPGRVCRNSGRMGSWDRGECCSGGNPVLPALGTAIAGMAVFSGEVHKENAHLVVRLHRCLRRPWRCSWVRRRASHCAADLRHIRCRRHNSHRNRPGCCADLYNCRVE